MGVFSWRCFRTQKYGFALGLIVLIGLLLKFYMSSDLFLHSWDERYHALVAKNMLRHPFVPTLYEDQLLDINYRLWTNNHIWLHKQPLTLWGISSSLAVFGVNAIAIRIPSILLMSLGTLISYRFGRKLFNRRVAFYAAVLYATNGLILEVTSGRVATDHVDVFFLFFIQFAALLAWEFSTSKKMWINILCGVCIGLAILSKWLPALIVLPIWGAFLLHTKHFKWKEILIHGFILCATIVAVALPWQLYIYSHFPLEAAWEGTFNQKHIFQVLDNQKQPLYYHFTMMRINYGELVYLPFIWFIYKTVKQRTNWKYWGLLIWIVVPYLFFSIVLTKMQGYTLFAAPALFIVIALFAHFLITQRHRLRYKWIAPLLVVLLFALPFRFTLERLKPFNTIESPEWQQDILKLSKEIDPGKKTVVFNVNRPVELMFHSNCMVYDHVPEEAILRKLRKEGYAIYINQKNQVNNGWVKSVYYRSLMN